jgi:toxin ParE1/3/4
MGDYRLAPAAERDLEKISRHTREQWGADQADLYTDILIGAFEALAHSPNTAPACDHIRAGYRRQMAGRHMIYFRPTDYGVAIVRIPHDRMDAVRRL